MASSAGFPSLQGKSATEVEGIIYKFGDKMQQMGENNHLIAKNFSREHIDQLRKDAVKETQHITLTEEAIRREIAAAEFDISKVGVEKERLERLHTQLSDELDQVEDPDDDEEI